MTVTGSPTARSGAATVSSRRCWTMCQGRSFTAALSRGDSRATSSVTTAAPKAAACAVPTRRTVRALAHNRRMPTA